MKCGFIGCKQEAKWAARKLFGKRDVLCTCDEHKPDASKRKESLRRLPMFYEISPLTK